MYSQFDVDRFAVHQMPPLLRKKGIYALLRCLLIGIKSVCNSFFSYRDSATLKVNHNSSTVSLEHFLNSLFVAGSKITITDYKDPKVYLWNEGESEEDVYMGYQDENVNFYLNSVDPSKVSGGFEVNVPRKLVSGQNIKTIQKWVDYYKPAGTAYTIKLV